MTGEYERYVKELDDRFVWADDATRHQMLVEMLEGKRMLSDAELSRLTALRVMGWEVGFWTLPESDQSDFAMRARADGVTFEGYGLNGILQVSLEWTPLLSDASACAVLDKMAAKHEYCMMRRSKDGWSDGKPRWYCGFSDEIGEDERLAGQAWHIDRRYAIVIAALKACGVEVGE